jgi:hypothetical protein
MRDALVDIKEAIDNRQPLLCVDAKYPVGSDKNAKALIQLGLDQSAIKAVISSNRARGRASARRSTTDAGPFDSAVAPYPGGLPLTATLFKKTLPLFRRPGPLSLALRDTSATVLSVNRRHRCNSHGYRATPLPLKPLDAASPAASSATCAATRDALAIAISALMTLAIRLIRRPQVCL